MNAPYTITPARYTKGKLLVRITGNGSGLKDRAERLICDGLKCYYTGRERGFVASPSKARRFERLYADGWDACYFGQRLVPPRLEAP